MITIEKFAERCANNIGVGVSFYAYWYPRGTGFFLLELLKPRTEKRVRRVVEALWQDPDVFPMYVVECHRGKYTLTEKSRVSDLLRDLLVKASEAQA